jgi:minor pilin subunit PapF
MFLVGGVMLTSIPASADDIIINITGEIVVPPCLVNNGGTIDVDFGDVSVTDVANARNVKTLNVPVSCIHYLGTPYVKVSGTQLSGAASNILATNISNFGIALYQGSSTSVPMVLGNGTSYGTAGYIGYPVQSGLSAVNDASSTFTFTAVPYKQGSGFPAAGAFSASANMSISYQ